jgi:hypothetical protein
MQIEQSLLCVYLVALETFFLHTASRDIIDFVEYSECHLRIES